METDTWARNVVANFKESAFNTSESLPLPCSSGRMCELKKLTISTNWLVRVTLVDVALVTVKAVTR